VAIPDFQLGAQWGARARWISHLIDFWGDPTDELKPPPALALPDRPEFLVLEFGATVERPWTTYATAGLSFVPQAGDGPMPYIELMACVPARDAHAPQLLYRLARDIALTTADEPAYKAWDLWRADLFGYRDFALTVPPEPDALLEFPDLARRPEDSRYVLAATGTMDAKIFLDLLQVVPLTVDEWLRATTDGLGTVLETIDWPRCSRTYGWRS
jgi:hypothetical protein